VQGLKPGAFQLWVRGSQRAPPHHGIAVYHGGVVVAGRGAASSRGNLGPGAGCKVEPPHVVEIDRFLVARVAAEYERAALEHARAVSPSRGGCGCSSGGRSTS
jgi:hypothetical protein